MTGDLFIDGDSIWTGDPAAPRTGAVEVRRGRVAAIGGRRPSGVPAVRCPAGACLVPGLIDAHLHLVLGGEQLAQLDLSGATSRAAFEAAVAQRSAALPEGRWLLAHGWCEDRWGGELPDSSWLAAAGDRPVVAYRMDIHAALVNERVLALVPTADDPPGGRIVRDAAGRPTGLMAEAAAWDLVNPVVPSPGVAERRQGLLSAQHHLHQYGLTSVGAMEYAAIVRDVIEPLRDDLTLRVMITMLDRRWPLDLSWATGFRNDDRLAVIGCKAFLDGTLGSRTAAMLSPYADDPGNSGLFVELAASGDLDAWAAAVAAAGLSPAMHAIGDAASRLAIDVIASLPPGTHARLEHGQHLHADDVARTAGMFVSMQPLHMVDDAPSMRGRLGAERLPGAFAIRQLAAADAVLAFGSDWPVVTACPIEGMRAAVTRLDRDGAPFQPASAISPEAALVAYTRGAAEALRLPDAGVIRPGAHGDFTLLDRDPLTADWIAAPPRAIATIVAGEVVWQG